MVSYVFQPEGAVNFIGMFHQQKEDQAVNLPPNLAELVMNSSYAQSPDSLVWRYFYDLKGIVCYLMKAFYLDMYICNDIGERDGDIMWFCFFFTMGHSQGKFAKKPPHFSTDRKCKKSPGGKRERSKGFQV